MTNDERAALIAETRETAMWWRSADHSRGKLSRPVNELLDALADALSSSPPAADEWTPQEPVWLIETPQTDNSPARWWNPDTGWMLDPNKALRLCREEDAAAVIKATKGLLACRPTEHIWYERKLLPKPLGHSYRDIDLSGFASPPAAGWKMVPVKFDAAMWSAANKHGMSIDRMNDLWRDLLAAVPSPPDPVLSNGESE